MEENITLQGVLREIEGLLVKLLAASNTNDDWNGKTDLAVELTESFRFRQDTCDGQDTFNENEKSSKTQIPKKESDHLPSPPKPCPDIHVPCGAAPAAEVTSCGPMVTMNSLMVVDELSKKRSSSSVGLGGEMHRQVSFQVLRSDQNLSVWDSDEESVEMNFQIHNAWQVLGERPSTLGRRRSSQGIPFGGITPEPTISVIPDVNHQESRRTWLPTLRIIWAWITGLVIMFDSATIPLMVFGNYRIWMGEVIFWMLNLPVRLVLLKYVGQGQPWGRFFAGVELPLLSVMLYELLDANASPLWQGGYMVRVLQIPRLYNITGIPRLVRRWFHGSSREVRAMANICASMILCIFCLHILTCLWFAVGSMDGAWAHTENLKELSMLDQYRHSAELALSRLHPSRTFENMQLNTQMERILAVLATGLALLGGSIFTSIVTNDLSDIRRVRRMQKEAEYQVSDFLMIYPVSWALELQVKDHLKQNMARAAPPGKEEMNEMLPDFLYRELCREALTPVLRKHEVLYDLCSHHLAFQYDLCVDCLIDWNVRADETLFSAGLKSEKMIILSSGHISYFKEKVQPQSASVMTKIKSSISLASVARSAGAKPDAMLTNEGDWMCEASLWCPWFYMGRAVSHSQSALLCLNHHKLLAAATRHKDASRELVVYARHFTERLRNMPEDQLSDLSFGPMG